MGRLEEAPPGNDGSPHVALKTDYELNCLRRANRCAALGHRAAEKAFRAHRSTLDIHLAYLAAIRHAEHELPYSSIVALNENCAVLHYQFLDRNPPTGGQWLSFLIDAGGITLPCSATD